MKARGRLLIRRPRMNEIKEIHRLINYYAEHREMLPRSLNELYENVHCLLVAELQKKIVGCCALKVTWEDLAEVKSLAVAPDFQRQGLGRALVNAALRDALHLGIQRVFALTFKPEFFQKLGFVKVSREDLPHKIWGECIRCPFFPDCNEIPMVKVL